MLLEHCKIKPFLISGVLALVTHTLVYAQAKPESNPTATPTETTKTTSSKSAHNSSSNPTRTNSPSAVKAAAIPDTAPQSQSSSKDDWWYIPYIISFAALCVSGGVALYTLRKDGRARRHSIEDDYWLRKVIGPIAIEPLLKNVLEMIGSAPADKASGNFEAEKVKTFHDEYLKKFADLAANVSALTLINAQLAASTSVHLDGIQELMIEYCSSNQLLDAADQEASPKSRKEFQDEARKQLISMLQGIKAYQMQIT